MKHEGELSACSVGIGLRFGVDRGKLAVQTRLTGFKSCGVGNVGFDYFVWVAFDSSG